MAVGVAARAYVVIAVLVRKECVDLARADDALADAPRHDELGAHRPERAREHHRRLAPRVILRHLALELGWRRDGRAIELELAVAVHCRAQPARFRAPLCPFLADARRRVGLGAALLEDTSDLGVVLARRVVAPPLEIPIGDGFGIEAGEEGADERGAGALWNRAEDGVHVRVLVKEEARVVGEGVQPCQRIRIAAVDRVAARPIRHVATAMQPQHNGVQVVLRVIITYGARRVQPLD